MGNAFENVNLFAFIVRLLVCIHEALKHCSKTRSLVLVV